MKKINLLLLVLFLVGCSILETKNNDLKDMKLNGKVKSITESNYEATEKFGEIIKGKSGRGDEFSQNTKYLFNKKGNLLERINFNCDGSFYSKGVYGYNENDKLIEKIWYKPENNPTLKILYKYDEKENKVEETRMRIMTKRDSARVRLDALRAKYNPQAIQTNIPQTAVPNSARARLDAIKAKYGNAQPNVIKNMKLIYKYDEKGKLTEENSYDSDGSLNTKIVYKYDDKGNKNEANHYKSDGSLEMKSTYKYDNKGNEIEYKSVGTFFFKNTYKYDERCNVIEDNWYVGEVTIDATKTYKYEFDPKGNWIRQIQFNDNIPKYITMREIEYY